MPFKVRVELSNGRSVGPRRAVRRVRFVLVVERRKGIKKCSSGPTAAAAEYDVAALVYLLLPLGGEGPRPHRVRLRRKVHIIGSGSAELGGQTGQQHIVHLTIATALWLLLYYY